MLTDQDNNVWVSSNKGISRVNLTDNSIIHYGKIMAYPKKNSVKYVVLNVITVNLYLEAEGEFLCSGVMK